MNRKRKNRSLPSFRTATLAGWIFLGVAIVAAIVAIVILLGQKEPEVPAWEPTYPSNETVAPPQTGGLAGADGGTSVIINGIQCSFTPPMELTFGVVESLDLTSIADTVCANAARMGWGNLVFSQGDDGALLFYPANAKVLPGDKYEEQSAFMKSSRPEDLARTFLTDSGIYNQLANHGITLSLDMERQGGGLLFRGTGEGVASDSWVRLSFLYDGSLNQMKVYAVHLADAVTTQAVVPMERAASQAVSWNSTGLSATQVTGAEIRSVSGIPFYAFTCSDNTTAYALAVEESALEASPRAKAVYEKLMLTGIQEYVRLEGAGY